MKKALRIFIPILLALAIILCSLWYLFVYDRAFTRDLLLGQARAFEKNGNHAVAAWFYDLAYQQAGDDDAVAIELAEQYAAAGNYTKAELTLSRAIGDGGGVELYVALSRTYVAQGKLLDAVTMLEKVANPEIKAQLDAMRPAAPTASPDPGFYSQYISVTVTADSGTLYVSANGEYPSVKRDVYTQPIALADGENALYALAVAENGLVSPLSIFGYTVGGVIEQVEFADPAMEEAIRAALNAPAGTALFTNELWDIKEFTVPAGVTTLEDLKLLPFLESLTVTESVSGGPGYLSSMANLKTLSITKTAISHEELAIIGKLPSLEGLTLDGCGLSSAAGLENAVNLTQLNLSNNTVRNITALASLEKLQTLLLPHNALTDLSPLAGLTALQTLDVSYNSLTSLSPLARLTGLTRLDASTNSITGIYGIEMLSGLTELSLAYNKIDGIAGLSGCTALRTLNVANNSLTDISAVAGLTALEALDFSYNQVTSLPGFSKSCALVTVDGSHNDLGSLDPLAGLENLNKIYMDYNADISSVSALKDCRVLVLVNVYGTKVTDVSALTSQDIIVNFNPTQG